MKRKYKEPKLETIMSLEADVIMTSGGPFATNLGEYVRDPYSNEDFNF